MSSEPEDLCWDAEPHDWGNAEANRRGEGLQCVRCGITEAELAGEEPEE